MNAEAFRHFYDYHFSENRKIWDRYVSQLSPEQFTRHVDYSRGSVQDQILHLISCETTWFSELRDVEIPEDLKPIDFPDRESIRAYWDTVEQNIREYLNRLQDDMLFDKPLSGEDKGLIVWQVLLHVVNHGTDHRAQLLRLLNDLGLKTEYQDYIFYVYEHL
jgi:uncharacterized damage-inducible protein DinB